MIKNDNITFKKFDFKWTNITPPGVTQINDVSAFNNTIIAATNLGIATKNQNSNWSITDKVETLSITDIESVASLPQSNYIATNGSGLIVKYSGAMSIKVPGFSKLPSHNVKKVSSSPQGDKGQDGLYGVACTDEGVYLFAISDSGRGVTHTTKNGLPSKNIINTSISNGYLAVITDNGLAIGAINLSTLGTIYKEVPVGLIDKNAIISVSIESFPEYSLPAPATGRMLASSNKKIAFSTNAGTSWKEVTPGNLKAGSLINCVYLFGNTLYAGTSDGLFVSHNDGLHWEIYTTADSLTGDNVRAISADPIYNNIILSTDTGISMGELFSWEKSTTGLPSNGYVSCIIRSENKNIFYAGVGYADKTTDQGLYQSIDGCKSWRQIYNQSGINSLFHHKFNKTLYVGTDSDGLLVYDNANTSTPSLSYTFTEKDGLLNNQVINVTGEAPNAFYARIAVSHSEGISYSDNARDFSAPWKILTPNNSSLPGKYIQSLKFINDKLYCCGTQNALYYDGYDAFFATSPRWDESTPIQFTTNYSNGTQLSSVDDCCVVQGTTFISSHDESGVSDLPGDIRSSTDISDMSKWKLDIRHSFWGGGMMTSSDRVIFLYTQKNLLCYRPDDGDVIMYNIDYVGATEGLQSPYITEDKIYLPSSNGCILISELSKLL
ncbi:hypothetical protein MF265_10240 [Serratia marcescens]|uniref:hypothetical protein n=1 Tax=Serratia marcescens TaxID=615 RepID=UPI001EF05F61|nr:hypothetical protein [Serratia marcescens]ULH13100.1 hypothetical protein MF265_10240 [Serratia marcescens]